MVFQLHQAGDGHGNPEGGARALQGAQRHERRVRTGSIPEKIEYAVCGGRGFLIQTWVLLHNGGFCNAASSQKGRLDYRTNVSRLLY